MAAAAEVHGADRVVAETNQGGEMVKAVLRAAGVVLPVTPATATKSKAARAEPVAGLFESGKARFGGRFPELEEQLGRMVPEGYARARGSPDRADAMVWALWALLLAPGRAAGAGGVSGRVMPVWLPACRRSGRRASAAGSA